MAKHLRRVVLHDSLPILQENDNSFRFLDTLQRQDADIRVTVYNWANTRQDWIGTFDPTTARNKAVHQSMDVLGVATRILSNVVKVNRHEITIYFCNVFVDEYLLALPSWTLDAAVCLLLTTRELGIADGFDNSDEVSLEEVSNILGIPNDVSVTSMMSQLHREHELQYQSPQVRGCEYGNWLGMNVVSVWVPVHDWCETFKQCVPPDDRNEDDRVEDAFQGLRRMRNSHAKRCR